MKSLIEASRER